MHNDKTHKPLKSKRSRNRNKSKRKPMANKMKEKWFQGLSANIGMNVRQRHAGCEKQKKSCSVSSQVSLQTSSFTEGLASWTQTYQQLLSWHAEHQMHFWRQRVQYLEQENAHLRQQLCNSTIKKDLQRVSEEYETSSEEEQEQEGAHDEVDPGYLDFIAVTLKHREELRLKREAAEQEEEAYVEI